MTAKLPVFNSGFTSPTKLTRCSGCKEVTMMFKGTPPPPHLCFRCEEDKKAILENNF